MNRLSGQQGNIPAPMIDDKTLYDWFAREIFPLERMLTAFLRRNSPVDTDLADLRQEIYERVFVAARGELPLNPRAYLITVARNFLIDRARRARIVSVDLFAELEEAGADIDMFATERQLNARDELRRTLDAVSRLPPRCREVVRLRKVEGLSTREVADRMGVSLSTVEKETQFGMRAIVDVLSGDDEQPRRLPAVSRLLRRRQS
jgi:RNA polymerase sigma factor (sigma-70 family)